MKEKVHTWYINIQRLPKEMRFKKFLKRVYGRGISDVDRVAQKSNDRPYRVTGSGR